MVVIEDQIHGSQVNNTLCHDILEQILCSVPVKSLLRFKAVCKTWFNLISSPRFVNLTICRDHNVSRIHLSGYNCSYRVVGELTIGKLRKEVCGNEGLPWYFSVPSIDANCSDIQLVEIGNPFNASLQSSNVAGSCNGVLFVIIKDDAFLWNPSTREHVKLPPSNAMLNLLYYSYGYRKIVGLGYNSVFDEYKAISLIFKCVRSRGCTKRISPLLIYSSIVGYWEETHQDVPCCFCSCYDSGITLNGCPHWSVHDCEVSSCSKPRTIMFFDTVDNIFKRLPTPIRWCYGFDNDNDPYLGVLRGCLSATGKNLIDKTTDVWVMNEYGVEDSWIKLFVIPLSNIDGFRIVPLGFMNHGDELVLEVNCDKIMTYNLKTKQKKFVIIRKNASYFDSVYYVTSLVSPRRFSTR